MQTIVFTCDASIEHVWTSLFIAGNLEQLGGWKPNSVRMYEDGTHGDAMAGDRIWSIRIEVPVGKEIQYKYTNSGKEGQWVPGEEFPSRNRSLFVAAKTEAPLVIRDVFGQLDKE